MNTSKNVQSKADLGQGDVRALLVRLAVPAVVAQVVNLLYNVVDRIYIGHIPGVGAAALTGVGLFTPILMLMTAFAMLAGAGGAPRAAMAMGRGDNDEAEEIMGNCCTMLLVFAALLTVVFYLAAPRLLVLFGASEATLPYALTYARIYILGSVFVLVVLGMNTFITTQGFARVSMLTTIIGAVINIILDPILIFGFDMGVAGAAIATVLSQAVGAVWILHFLLGSQTTLRLRARNLRLRRRVILPCLALGSAPFVMCGTESLLSICFTSSLARYGGDLAVGTMTIASSMVQMVQMPLQGICQGGQPIMSYNYGAKQMDRVRGAFRAQLTACGVYAIAYWALVMLLPGVFVSIFTSDAALAGYAVGPLRVYMAGIMAIGFQICCQQSFMALGQAGISLFLACLRKLILLIPLIYILPCFLADKVFAVFLAEPVSDIIAAIVTVSCFYVRSRRILQDPGVEKAA